ncbi:hypothetical protein HRR83_007858 [Exophiala dermatitidis]|uniref:Uncharacterized protein n=1 Tax=Exophiala dermatitidis TaxID=5970 RepID=A0AAN6ITU2_EXODE|nr:hypothetical protein HRR75_006861 [Exophiala dermatitidis]KAJ4508894.1 hypothetical protein HRR74_007486 [Exophiala dermatitidis]KAJ4510146.1 hypothetical protein HRR73_006944 [Exophiala dermatitidis]KAJ4539152.1 hypothetical protein HRR77_006565 [Exophiala dermatitidis]KAJ4540569.1 hypothetical protein HRR76_003957 [Exophiala dermatitidis]
MDCDPGSSSSPPPNPNLYDGEVLWTINNAPTITYFKRGDTNRPLCVLIPGAAHLARIFYGGHKSHDPRDFLAHWLVTNPTSNPKSGSSKLDSMTEGEAGYNILAISYPLETTPPLMPSTRPDFTVREWGVQAAEATKRVMDRERLSCDVGVILLVWSMAGKIIAPFDQAARARGFDVRLVVSLNSTPPLRGLRGNPPRPAVSQAGYVHGGHVSDEYFLRQLREQRAINSCASTSTSGSESVDGGKNSNNDSKSGNSGNSDNTNGSGSIIVPDDIFIKEYTGNFPVGLAAWGLRWSRQDQDGTTINNGNSTVHSSSNGGKMIDDPHAGYEVYDETTIKDLPPMCALYGDSPADLRHSAGDRSMWAFLISHNLMGGINAKESRFLAENPEVGKRVIKLIHAAPDRLCAEVEGGHHFFLGEKGAKRTATWVIEMEKRMQEVKRELDILLGRDQTR